MHIYQWRNKMSRLFKSYEHFKQTVEEVAAKQATPDQLPIEKANLLRLILVTQLEKKFGKSHTIRADADATGVGDITITKGDKKVEEYLQLNFNSEATYAMVWELYDTLNPEDKVEIDLNKNAKDDQIYMLNVDEIIPNPHQPRTNFDSVPTLAESIKQDGQKEPIEVVFSKEQGKYVISDGERRWRAVKSLGLSQIRAFVLKDDVDLLHSAMVSMAQRDNMNVVDWAKALVKINLQIKQTNTFGGRKDILPKDKFDKKDLDPYSFPAETRKLINETYGINERKLYNIVGVLKQPEEMQEKIAKGRQYSEDGRFTVEFNKDDFPVEFRKAMVEAEKKSKVLAKIDQQAKDVSTDDTKYLTLFLPMEKWVDRIKKQLPNINMDNVSQKTRDDIQERFKKMVKELNPILKGKVE